MAAGEGFKQAAFGGFDKNEVNAYINNLSKKISSLEADLQSKDDEIRAARASADEANKKLSDSAAESQAKIEELNKQLLEERHNVINLKKEADILKAKLSKAEKTASSLSSAAQKAGNTAKANADAKLIMDRANAEIKAKCDRASAEIKAWIEKANADVRNRVDKANAELKIRAEKAEKEASLILEQAERSAGVKLAKADKEAAAKIEQADVQSKLIIEKAERTAKGKLESAGEEAKSRIKAAEMEAQEKRARAESDVKQILAKANSDAAGIRTEAKAKADKIIEDIRAAEETNFAVIREIRVQLETISEECGTLNDMAGRLLLEGGLDNNMDAISSELATLTEPDKRDNTNSENIKKEDASNNAENKPVFDFTPEMPDIPNMPGIPELSAIYGAEGSAAEKTENSDAINEKTFEGSIPLDEIWNSEMLPHENNSYSIGSDIVKTGNEKKSEDSGDNDENFGSGDDILPLDSDEALFDLNFSGELLGQTTPENAIKKDDFDGDILSSLEDANRENTAKPSLENSDKNGEDADSSSESGDPWSELQRQLEEMEKSGNFPGAF